MSKNSIAPDKCGEIVEETTYLPFGEVQFGGTEENFLFTSKEKDDTGLYYYGARYYDPYMRQFVQADTIIQDIYNPQNLNRYSYVLNNPFKYIDPSGHKQYVSDPAHALNWISFHLALVICKLRGETFHEAVEGSKVPVYGVGYVMPDEINKYSEIDSNPSMHSLDTPYGEYDETLYITSIKNVPKIEEESLDTEDVDKELIYIPSDLNKGQGTLISSSSEFHSSENYQIKYSKHRVENNKESQKKNWKNE